MVFDTDVAIWALRGGAKAAQSINKAKIRAVSLVTYMELVQGARDKRELQAIKAFLTAFEFETLPLTENLGHRASIYLEEYGLVVGMGMADALIAATAIETNATLMTANRQHFKSIQELSLMTFTP